jgi:hypothetical protein
MSRRELKLYASGGALILGAWGGAQLAPQDWILEALVVGYLAWALFWGVPPVWRFWRRQAGRFLFTGCNLLGWPLAIAIGVALFIVTSWFYSVFGGGIYEFVKCLGSVRRPASGP